MQHPDSAKFIYSMTKRARKYYLGITTITQDVEDFLHNDYGKAIVSNASIQFLMKQSTASIPVLADTFYLSEGERQLLVSSDIGEGIFFAGHNHVALRVVASQEEHKVITSDPAELMARQSPAEFTNQPEADAESATQETSGQTVETPTKTESNSVKQQANQASRREGHYTIEDYQHPSDEQG
jgi:hypothetical protein